MKTRTERDSMGELQVPEDRLWGAQTQRALHHFEISHERLPTACVRALGHIKRAAAETNTALGRLESAFGDAIARAATEVAEGRLAAEFPLVVWQTGSGTQTHMNVNEVIANRASELLGGARGVERRVHPNDHVNAGQSSNDVFSTAVNLSALFVIDEGVIPSVQGLAETLRLRASEFSDLVKVGRTHLQDATPLTLGQEIGGWAAQLEHGVEHLRQTRPHLCELALGGTAVGTGLNAHPEFAERVAQRLAELTGLPLVSAPNKFEAQAAHDAIVFAHAALKTLATSLTKIANDIRWLASGPRAGLSELILPANEPGSSIMPGKVNPTQCEALLMCCSQVLGNDVAVTIAGGSGNLQLNVQKPLLAYGFAQSARLLTDSVASFRKHLVAGLGANRERISELVARSLMLVTALAPKIGYDNAATVAKLAHDRNLSLRDAALQSGLVSAEDFDRLVRPETMVEPR